MPNWLRIAAARPLSLHHMAQIMAGSPW
ncbi:protein of unknown function [Azospirillum baldaniorum]|uniref:Uncharacterized protein n=1 Tax=Azospirillum baldaniorum TaxID=1064539 RepID=A0A9P1JPZ9_9PROT|nr:protein of unknown function [Azospirillum baldaniorum]